MTDSPRSSVFLPVDSGMGSIVLFFIFFTGTTTMLKCFNTLPCGGLGVSQGIVLLLIKISWILLVDCAPIF